MATKDDILTKLDDTRFREEIQEWFNRVLSLAGTAQHGELQGFENLTGDWDRCLQFAYDVENEPGLVFAEGIMNISAPQIVTPEELGDSFHVYLQAADSWPMPDFDELYDAFLNHVSYRLLAKRQSRQLELCTLWGLEEEDGVRRDYWLLASGIAIGRAGILGEQAELEPFPERPQSESPLVLWSHDGLTLQVIGLRQTSEFRGRSLSKAHAEDGILLCQLTGHISPAALAGLERELMPAIRAVIQSVSLLRPPEKIRIVFGDESLPALHLDELQEYRTFIAGCASLVFMPGPTPKGTKGKKNKDSMARRFSNAIRLLTEAGRQTVPAITLALAVAAIEPLLGRRNENIASSLSERIPILLEPDHKWRGKASEVVTNLYDVRSRALHGDQLEAGGSGVHRARTLAAGCLYALWFRNDFKARLDEPLDTPDVLLKELKDLRWEGRIPDGVPDLPAVRALWRQT